MSDTVTPPDAGDFTQAPSGRLAAALTRGTLRVEDTAPGALQDPRRTFGRAAAQPRLTQFAWLPERDVAEALVCLDQWGQLSRIDAAAGHTVRLAPTMHFLTMQVGHCTDRVALSTPAGAVRVLWARQEGDDGIAVPLPEGAQRGAVRELAWSPDDRILAIGLGSAQAFLFDVALGTLGPPFAFHTYAASFCFSHDGLTLATVLPNGNAAWFDTRTSAMRHELASGGVLAMAFSPSDQRFAMALESKVEVVETAGAVPVCFVSAPRKGTVTALHFADEGQLVLKRSDNTEDLLSLTAPPNRVLLRQDSRSICTSADGRLVAWVLATGQIAVSRSEQTHRPLLHIDPDARVGTTLPHLTWASHAPVLLADYGHMLRRIPIENLPSPTPSRSPSPDPWGHLMPPGW